MKIKSNDTAIVFSGTLSVNGAPANLTGATVLFILAGDTQVFSAPAAIVEAAAGTVSYQPTDGFPTAPGEYRQEWEVTFSDERVLTFPNDKYNKVTIIADLNAV